MARWLSHRARAALKWQVVCAAVFGCVAMLPPSARALIRGEAVTLEYQVKNSDVILRGTCEDSVTTWSNGHFVTTYKIAVKKYLKTPGKMSLETHPVLAVSQLGGRVERPLPLAESYQMMAALYPGEEVVLFLQSPAQVPAVMRARYERYVSEGRLTPSPLMANYRLTTLNISKLTVVTDPQTGAELVTRVNFGRFGVSPSADAVKRYVDAYESQQPFVEVQRGSQRVRIPVQIGRPVPQAGSDLPSMEERIRRMRSYTSTWEDFQRQTEAILRGESKTSESSVVGGVRSSQPFRMIQPGKEQ